MDWFGNYIKTGSAQDLWLLALWAAHTRVVQHTGTSPRLIVTSSLPGAGKTTVLEHLQRLCYQPLMAAHVSSVPLLSRTVADGGTLLIDEAEKHIGRSGGHTTDLLAIINSGYKSSGSHSVLAPTADGAWERHDMPTYSPVAMAGNSPELPDDTRSRCVEILLMPDVHDEADRDGLGGARRRLPTPDQSARSLGSSQPRPPPGPQGHAAQRHQGPAQGMLAPAQTSRRDLLRRMVRTR